MSGRLERVRMALLELGGRTGISAQALAEVAGIDRSNASRELNRLVLAGQARKVPGKPVRFLPLVDAAPAALAGAGPVGVAAAGLPAVGLPAVGLPAVGLPAGGSAPGAVRKAVMPSAAAVPPGARPGERVALDGLQGAQGSLKSPIALAKAAILYPGGGLHTLILGQTGVGKSLFAEEMYRFAVAQGALPTEAPFVVFNCADYASNPQLLLSQLFGAVKGAYTGATADRQGVVEEAAGGMLFLDEIHRLPPEGQEMLFLLLDRGQLRRLGDTQLRSVKVRVVSATTEDPESSLLGTFLRRIPMVIRVPALAERPVGERLDLIIHCLQTESDRVGMPVEVSAAALSRLIRYAPRGNVGQLKADIQLACARAFLDEALAPTGLVRVDEHALPIPEKGAPSGPPQVGAYRFNPGAQSPPTGRMGEAIYERIVRRVQELETEGRLAESSTLISAEIDEYFAGVTDADPDWQQAVRHLVGPQVLGWAGDMLELAQEQLGLALEPRVWTGLAMHIASTVERMRQGRPINYPRLRELKQKYPKEVAAAAAMAERLERLSGLALPPDETGFLASFLLGVGGMVRGKVGMLVICHGSQTARALVQTVKELAGDTARLAGVDWPVGEPLEQLLGRAEAELRGLNAGQGVLVLVDMGPLVAVGELLTQRTGIPTRTVDMVSTPRLLEAVRKAQAVDMTLEDLARLVADVPAYSRAPARAAQTGAPVLLTSCLTGEASARRLGALLAQSVPELTEAGVEILPWAPAPEKPLSNQLADMQRQRPVLAVVATVDPGVLPVPVIRLEDLLMGPGTARLRHLAAGAAPTGPSPLAQAHERAELLRQMPATLARQIKAVDPTQVVAVVGRALNKVEADLAITLSLDVFAGLTMTLACLVDQLVAQGPQPERELPAGSVARTIAGGLEELERTFGVQVPSGHLERMALMIGG